MLFRRVVGYGATVQELSALASAQRFECACCGKAGGAQVVDHDHRGRGAGSVRGIVCRSCNALVGAWECGRPGKGVRAKQVLIEAYLLRFAECAPLTGRPGLEREFEQDHGPTTDDILPLTQEEIERAVRGLRRPKPSAGSFVSRWGSAVGVIDYRPGV